MEHKFVYAAGIISVGYDPALRILEICWKKGLYGYADVPLIVYERLMESTEKTTYFTQRIRGHYRAWRIE